MIIWEFLSPGDQHSKRYQTGRLHQIQKLVTFLVCCLSILSALSISLFVTCDRFHWLFARRRHMMIAGWLLLLLLFRPACSALTVCFHGRIGFLKGTIANLRHSAFRLQWGFMWKPPSKFEEGSFYAFVDSIIPSTILVWSLKRRVRFSSLVDPFVKNTF